MYQIILTLENDIIKYTDVEFDYILSKLNKVKELEWTVCDKNKITATIEKKSNGNIMLSIIQKSEISRYFTNSQIKECV